MKAPDKLGAQGPPGADRHQGWPDLHRRRRPRVSRDRQGDRAGRVERPAARNDRHADDLPRAIGPPVRRRGDRPRRRGDAGRVCDRRTAAVGPGAAGVMRALVRPGMTALIAGPPERDSEVPSRPIRSDFGAGVAALCRCRMTAQQEKGKAAYAKAGCETCHGPGGNGNGQGPALVPFTLELPELVTIVRQGVGLMPGTPRDRSATTKSRRSAAI